MDERATASPEKLRHRRQSRLDAGQACVAESELTRLARNVAGREEFVAISGPGSAGRQPEHALRIRSHQRYPRVTGQCKPTDIRTKSRHRRPVGLAWIQ